LVIKTLNPNPDPEPDPKPDPKTDPKTDPEPDSLELLNPDLHCNAGTRVLTSGERKLKILQPKKILHFLIKNCNLLIPGPPYRTSKLQEKSSSLSYTSKLALSSCWSVWPSWIRIRIRIPITDPDPAYQNKCGFVRIRIQIWIRHTTWEAWFSILNNLHCTY
jgi:hypothetical protein